MSLFSLREDQVEEDWIAWCRTDGPEFGDFTFTGATDDDDFSTEGVRSRGDYETDPQGQEAIDGFEQELTEEGGTQQTRIPFVDMTGSDDDDYDWTDIPEIDSAGNEVGREAQEDEGTAGMDAASEETAEA